jgi:hypothetical protein
MRKMAMRLQAGSIIARMVLKPGISWVEIVSTEDVVAELMKQVDDPESVLRQGKYGKYGPRAKSLKIVMDKDMQSSHDVVRVVGDLTGPTCRFSRLAERKCSKRCSSSPLVDTDIKHSCFQHTQHTHIQRRCTRHSILATRADVGGEDFIESKVSLRSAAPPAPPAVS